MPRWPATTVLLTALAYYPATHALYVARDRPAGPPTTNDLLLACGVFPLALIGGFLLFCLSVGVTIFTPGRPRLLAALATTLTAAALATTLTAAALVLSFRGT